MILIIGHFLFFTVATLVHLTLKLANRIIEHALHLAKQKQMPPIAVAVLDAGAHPIALQRQDGVTFLRVQIAQAKAWGSLALGINSDQIAQRYLHNQQQQGFINALNGMTGGQLIPLPGGVLIKNESGEIIGAAGAAGGESADDEACIMAAIDEAGLYR